MALTAVEAFKRFEKLKSDRSNWESLWQDVADYFLPNKNDITSVGSSGRKRNLQIYDSTGIRSAELLTGALHGMLTNPSTYWFELYSGIKEVDEDDDARLWFQEAARTMHDIVNGSNFQPEVHEMYTDEVNFGTGAMSINEDEVDVVRFMTHHISRVWIEEDARGDVCRVFLKFDWKPRDCIKEFEVPNGKKLPKWVHDMDKKDSECKIEVLQIIDERSAYDNKAIDSTRYKYASCWYIRGGNKEPDLVKESGFRTKPIVTPRWTKGTGESYGRSASMNALCDVKMLNKMMQTVIRGAEKAVDPPLLVPDDSVIGTVKTTPGGLNHFRAGTQDFIRPLETGSKLDMGYQIIENVRGQIRECFYLNQLQLQDGPQKTATEVMQITEENRRFLGPIVGRQETEFLRPWALRVFEICERRKKFKPYPPIMLQYKPQILVRYRSMLAKAQQSVDIDNIGRAIGSMGALFQIDPNSIDIIDADKGVKYIANVRGIPQELIRDDREVKKIREAKAVAAAQAQAKADEAEQAEQVGKVAPAIAKIAT